MVLNLNVESSMLVCQTLENGISYFRKLHEEKEKAISVQIMLDKYFSTK
jgi:hypothetical protein